MEYIFCGRYRTKKNGFQYKWMKGGEREAKDHFGDDQIRTFFSLEFGPLLNAMLWVREDGRLSLSISGLGRPVLGLENDSPWVDGNDTKILYLYVTEERSEERAAIYALFKAFSSDPFEYGRRLLGVFLPLDGDVDYAIDADGLDEIMSSCSAAGEPVVIADTLKRNAMIAYYTYVEFSSESELCRFRSYLYQNGIAHLASGFFAGEISKEGHAAIIGHLKKGCRDIPYAVKSAVDKFTFNFKYR